MLQSWAELRRHHPAAADGTEGAILRDLTRERGLGNNSTYCHGDLGSLDGLLEAARAEGDHEAAAVLRQSIRDLVEDQLDPDRGTPCDRYSYTDSLMVGRSGKLWSGLRAVDPDQYPSPLCLG
jgi:lantibiotic modifying enzyme